MESVVLQVETGGGEGLRAREQMKAFNSQVTLYAKKRAGEVDTRGLSWNFLKIYGG
jgi:hypothetical protein